MQNKSCTARVIITWVILSTIFIAGCQYLPFKPSKISPNPFTSTLSLNEEDRTFSISGNSAGHVAGKRSEFQLSLDNRHSENPWNGKYCILLIDQGGVKKQISHEQYDIPAGQEIQKQIAVEFPENFNGPLGLCIIISQRASMVTTLWIGDKYEGTVDAWPNIKTCPQ